MGKRSKKAHKPHARLQGYVVVAFAEDWEQARDYKTLLEASDIPAMISEQHEPTIGSEEIAVMVSEEFLDEAHVIIESQHAYDDLYDFALEDEEEDDLDEDFFEEEY